MDSSREVKGRRALAVLLHVSVYESLGFQVRGMSLQDHSMPRLGVFHDTCNHSPFRLTFDPNARVQYNRESQTLSALGVKEFFGITGFICSVNLNVSATHFCVIAGGPFIPGAGPRFAFSGVQPA